MDDRDHGPAVDGERVDGDEQRPAGPGPEAAGSDTGTAEAGVTAPAAGDEPGGETAAGAPATGEGTVAPAEPVDPLTAVAAERDEYLDALRRLQAEFDNYRKRVAKQQAEEADRRAARLVIELLPVLDALDLAASHLAEPPSDDGRALVASAALLNDVLRKEGLERIDPVGEEFDPTAHEAVGHLPAEAAEAAEAAGAAGDAGEPGGDGSGGEGVAGGGVAGGGDAGGTGAGGTGPDALGETEESAASGVPSTVVAQVMRAGYRYRGTVVRPAMVLVRG